MTKPPIWYGVAGFLGRLIIFFAVSWICLIWLNMYLFYWWLYLRYVVTWILFNILVRCLLEISSMNFVTVVGYFLPILMIHTLVIFLAGESAVPWAIVCWLGDIVHVVMLVVLSNYTNRSTSWWKRDSNFKYIIFDEGLVWEINFHVVMVETFMPLIRSEPVNHPSQNLYLCSLKN